MPVVQVKWAGMLSPCLQFPVTLNLISPNQELSPVPLHISDCTAHVSAPCSSWLHCLSPVSYLPLHICTSPVPTLCISLSGEGIFFQEDGHRIELQGAACPATAWSGGGGGGGGRSSLRSCPSHRSCPVGECWAGSSRLCRAGLRQRRVPLPAAASGFTITFHFLTFKLVGIGFLKKLSLA